MIRAEPAFDKRGRDVWYATYRLRRFWHTIRNDRGQAVCFKTQAEAEAAAREEWWPRMNGKI